MKIFRFIATLLICLNSISAAAHTPLFDCFVDGDDITCEGGFSDGSSAQGIAIRVINAQGKVLQQGKLNSRGSIALKHPKGEFSVVFDPGSEHSITVLGDEIY